MSATKLIDLKTISALSLFITTILVANAANQHQQFYLTVVNLVSSKISKIVLIGDLILLIIYFGKLLSKLFFGSLRIYEEEIVWEKGYFALIETCLAMTIFREELSTRMLAMMISCLFLKIFHWISELRVKHLESLPTTSTSVFFRLYSCLFILIGIDVYFSQYLIQHYLKEGVTLRILFLSDFLIMGVIGISISIRLLFHAYNLSKQDVGGNSEWEGRDVSIFYLEIISELLQSLVYLSFFLMIMSKFGLPFHLLRNIYITISNVKKKITDLINYRRAASTLDEKFVNATQQDLDDYDGVCVVCREDMITNTEQNTIKKLPCNHLFHAKCLRGCLERSQECPTCRRPIDVLLKEQEEHYHSHNNQNHSRNVPVTNTSNNIGSSAGATGSGTASAASTNNIGSSAVGDASSNLVNSLQFNQQEIFNNLLMTQQELFNTPTTASTPNIPTMNNSNEQVQQIMVDMYVRYLESMRDNINQTLEQLKQLQ